MPFDARPDPTRHRPSAPAAPPSPASPRDLRYGPPRTAKRCVEAIRTLNMIELRFAGGRRWCKDRLADRRGRVCLIGALVDVHLRGWSDNVGGAAYFLHRAVLDASPGSLIPPQSWMWALAGFNDDREHRYPEIAAMLARARQLALARQEELVRRRG